MAILILLALYCLPRIIASVKGHHNSAAIWLVNLFLGWSFIGWFWALIWACANPPPAATQTVVVSYNNAPQYVPQQQLPQQQAQLTSPISASLNVNQSLK
jgi:hypothetical protein